jgi:hypothetical protein
MPHELIHTSAARGLALGTDGYCVVAETPGLPKALRTHLERLSGYRHRVTGRRPDLTRNPVAFSHQMVSAGGERYHVLSRIADAGFDHTDRTNYIAHHLAFTSDELPDGGPAWLASRPQVFQTEWGSTRPPETLPAGRRVPDGDAPARRCDLWHDLTGDGGWAGVLAATTQPMPVLYTPGQPVLELAAEAMALLPPDRRWQVSFTTYFTGGDYLWRFMPADSREAQAALDAGGKVLRLDKPMSGSPGGPLATAARTGVVLNDRPARRPTAEMLEPDDAPPVRRTRRNAEVDYEPEVVEVDEPVRPSRAERRREERVAPPVAPAKPAGNPIMPLLLGLGFGLALALLVGTITEFAGKKSLLHAVGVGPEKERQDELEKQKSDAESRISDGEAARERMQQANAVRITDLQDKLEAEKKLSQATQTKLTEAEAKVKDLETKAATPADDTEAKKAWEAKKTELEAKHTEALNKEKARADAAEKKARAAEAAQVLTPNKSLALLPPGTAATVKVLHAPFGWRKKEASGGQQVEFNDGSPESAALGSLAYSPEKGTLDLRTTDPKAWVAGGVAVVHQEGKPPLYFQLGPPVQPQDGRMRPDAKEKVFTLDLTAKPAGKSALAFAEPVLVRVGNAAVRFTPEGEKDAPPVVAKGRDKDKEYTLKLDGSKLTLSGVEFNESGPIVVVTWAELSVPAADPKAPRVPAVRITETR